MSHNYTQKDLERFWSKVAIADDPDQCWEWTAALRDGQYGAFRFGSIHSGGYKMLFSHRVSYEINKGEIPEGLKVLHICDNPKCCNPKHLFVGTDSDNVQDMIRKGRRYQPDNSGENSGRTNLTWKEVREIRRRYKEENIYYHDLAKEYRVSKATIGSIIRVETWIEE